MRPGDRVVRMVDVMAAPAVSLHPADRSCAKAEYDFNLDLNATISITPSAKQVLIVEDDPSIADVLEDVLHEHGYGVKVAHTGVEALSALRIGHTDLVLLDLMLPDMNGWRFFASPRTPARRRDTCSRDIGSRSRGNRTSTGTWRSGVPGKTFPNRTSSRRSRQTVCGPGSTVRLV
jgi:Response regulator receiver domain